MEMLIKENANRIYTERSGKEGTMNVLYITDFRKENTKKETGVVDATPASNQLNEDSASKCSSSNNSIYSVSDDAMDYANDPIGSFFKNATRRR